MFFIDSFEKSMFFVWIIKEITLKYVIKSILNLKFFYTDADWETIVLA